MSTSTNKTEYSEYGLYGEIFSSFYEEYTVRTWCNMLDRNVPTHDMFLCALHTKITKKKGKGYLPWQR